MDTTQTKCVTEAKIIFSQISITTKMACGIRELKAFRNSKDETVLSFRVGQGQCGFYILVTLNSADTYEVKLSKMKRKNHELVTVEEVKDVYCDELSDTIYHMVNK